MKTKQNQLEKNKVKTEEVVEEVAKHLSDSPLKFVNETKPPESYGERMSRASTIRVFGSV